MWDKSYNEHLQPQYAAPALRFGTLIHRSLADWYVPGTKRGANPVDSFTKYYEIDVAASYETGFRDEDGVWWEAGELGVAMMSHYLEQYGKDSEWEVLVTEQPFRQVVNHPVTGKPWFMYAGIVDGIWKHRPTKRLYIADHKTAKSIQTKHLQLDDQAGGYWTFAVDWMYAQGLLKRGQILTGMMYNFMRKAVKDPRPQDAEGHYLNKDGSVSKVQPSAYFLRPIILRSEADRDAVRVRAMAQYKEIEAIRAGELQLYKSPGQMTCTMCSWFDACELDETGHDTTDFLKQTTKPWNPYDEHAIRDSEQK